jgi:hypothetical protein
MVSREFLSENFRCQKRHFPLPAISRNPVFSVSPIQSNRTSSHAVDQTYSGGTIYIPGLLAVEKAIESAHFLCFCQDVSWPCIDCARSAHFLISVLRVRCLSGLYIIYIAYSMPYIYYAKSLCIKILEIEKIY